MNGKKNIIELNNNVENKNKLLLDLEIVLIIITLISFFTLVLLIGTITMPLKLKVILGIIASLILVIGVIYSIKIEQIAGYYKCSKCNHKYIPTYKGVFFAMHIGRTRYMKCPKCNNRSWNKKVTTK